MRKAILIKCRECTNVECTDLQTKQHFRFSLQMGGTVKSTHAQKPGEGILNIAKEVNASLIITGSRGQSKSLAVLVITSCIMRPFPCWKKVDQGKCKKKMYSFVYFTHNINHILWNVFINLSANLLYTICLVYVLCIMFFFYLCLCTCIHTLFLFFARCLYNKKRLQSSLI